MLFKELHDKLYDYQRDGVAFLYSLHRDGLKGGILADDMGLGKTIQVISFLSGMYDNELIKNALLVMPTSLITNWTKEFAKWTPGMRVKEFHGTSKVERTRNLEKVQRRGGVIISTYTMLMNNWQQLSSYQGREFTWDYMILDEAHKIKNSSCKTTKSACAIPSKNRVLLTGTPVQNNLREMWALFDFACQGALLGTAKTFKSEYENPITRARERDATPGEMALGARMSENLMGIIKPYFLRRTKAQVQKKKQNSKPQCNGEYSEKDSQEPDGQEDSGAVMPTLTRKNDLIVWTYLSAVQEDIYRQFISLDQIKELLMTSRSPLAELNILKKLCDHPRLLSAKAIANLGLEENSADSQDNDDMPTDTNSIANLPDDTLISESGKLVFLMALLEQLRQEGHRTLIFAHYRKVLDILERILGNRGFKVMRLDGTITQIAERERLITLFQTDESYSVFLLTTQVGGVGITLTAANRVVIYDPSWNPATDAQAVDRAYRIGQTENVVIYRLITCGTVEEKIYRRQVFKDSLIRQNTGDKKNPFRYFSKQELKELFTLEETRSSSTQMQLQALHSQHRRTDPDLDEHIAHLHAMEMFGISDHDLMFSLDVNHDEPPEDQQEHHYIEGRVQKAQELMKAESELHVQLAESMALNTEPAFLRETDSNNRERSHEKKPRNPRPSPPFPQHDHNVNRSPIVVDLDESGSGKEGGHQNQSHQVIDLSADESRTEEETVEAASEGNLDSPKPQSIKQDKSCLEASDICPQEVIEESVVMSEAADATAGDAADVSVKEVMDASMTSEADDAAAGDAAGENSLPYVEYVCKEHLNQTSDLNQDDSKMDLQLPGITPVKNKRLSVLQGSSSSFKADTSSRVSAGLDSFGGNFNLQLEDSEVLSDHDNEDHQETEAEEEKLLSHLQMEDSEVLSDHDNEDHQETEAEEEKLLSHLQMEGSFDVDKYLSERQHREALGLSLNVSCSNKLDESVDDSIVTTKRKKAAVIYDSDEEEGDDDEEEEEEGKLECSLQVLEASTPKQSTSTPLRSRKSVGGNTSVASRWSLLKSIIDDQEEAEEEEEEEEEEEDMDEEEEEEEAEEEEEKKEEDMDKQEEEEDMMEEEEEEEDMDEEEDSAESADTVDESKANSRNLEDSTGLKSNGNKDFVKSEPPLSCEDGSYDWLVGRGRECYSGGKLDDALGFFLKAIDIKPGDPEIQFMTIQIYRQLSLPK
ncbi:DNA excision repair protein ERCC-6-like [Scomber japonicus]|uniref:DNA excision repair protein ERCC-6-like n=1 Tax=Scomber japonicus TaxID=13676 RepID=UPI002306D8C0|nr:DNA excision repair protein ERCC-6-like [Scomber japonicus]